MDGALSHGTLEAIRLMAVARVPDGEAPSEVFACLQTEIKPILPWIAAVDPAEHLSFLRRGQTAWPPGCGTGAQGTQAKARFGRCLQPSVDAGAAEAVGGCLPNAI